MKNKVIEQCVEIFKRDDFKRELKMLFSPLIDVIMSNIYPYIYLSLVFVIISFLLHLGILILLMRNKKILSL